MRILESFFKNPSMILQEFPWWRNRQLSGFSIFHWFIAVFTSLWPVGILYAETEDWYNVIWDSANIDDVYANTDDVYANTDDVYANTDDVYANTHPSVRYCKHRNSSVVKL